MWKKSKLHKGDRVKVPANLFVTNSNSRLVRAEYEDETSQGILLKCMFEPGPCTTEPTWFYRTFVSWASIFCGDIKLQTEKGESVIAERFF